MISSAASRWHAAGCTKRGLGKDGDYHLNTTTGDVSVKSSGVWTVAMNVVGDMGPEGPAGPIGPAGPQGVPGEAGHSPATTSTTNLAVGNSGSISLILANNRNAFGFGQRIRIASIASPVNWM